MADDGSSISCPPLEQLEQLACGAATPAGLDGHVRACRHCHTRLQQIQADNELLSEFVGANADRLASSSAGDTDVPGYDIQAEIHRGGQGVVYRAVQRATKRVVAVKMLLQGSFATTRQRQRFEREVELVASLRHPNIVTLYDSGQTSDGRHYLAMEHVEGLPLDTCLQQQNAGVASGAALRSILGLFEKICDAVSHAHQHGILHRDLKPGNILVDSDGEPQVLDFGLAKPLHHDATDALTQTRPGEFVGTFAYAAPEQLQADGDAVDVRTDVYALGVILYEMLTGRRPHGAAESIADLVRCITEEPPERPSTLNPGINDEVETILLKAMSKDRDRRYQSAAALLEDVRLYLAGEAINAKRDSRWYLLKKVVARHKVGATLAAGFLLTVLGFALTMSVLYRRAVNAEQAKIAEARKATETLRSFLQVLGTVDPRGDHQVDSIPDFVDQAARIVERDLVDFPEIAAATRAPLGLYYLATARYEDARRHLKVALQTRRRLHIAPHTEIAASCHDLARVLWHLGQYEEAAGLYREALTMRQQLFGTMHPLVALSMSHLAACQRQLGNYEEAESLYRQALDMRKALFGARHTQVANSLNSLGMCLRDLGRYAEAKAHFAEALDMIRPLAEPTDWRVARAMHNVAICMIDLGEHESAQPLLAESLRVKRALYGSQHSDVARGEYELARLHLLKQELSAAGDACRRALAVQEAVYDRGHTETADSLLLMGRILLAEGRPAEARGWLVRALDMQQAVLPAGHRKIADARAALAGCLQILQHQQRGR